MALLYYVEMNVDPANPKAPNRDRFVLSKGHAAPALYATLAEKGYFPKEELLNLRKIDHMLQGHPDMKHTPGVDMSTGSLGQGISAACGMALAGKIDNPKFTVLSTPPAACTAPENAPAKINIRHIIIMFSLPMLLATTASFWLKLSRRFCKNAITKAIKKATIVGSA